MTANRDGYHNLNAQIPLVIWRALVADAEKKDISVGKLLTKLAQQAYGISDEKIPKPRRPGRKPNKS